jgi:hypothetical protein
MRFSDIVARFSPPPPSVAAIAQASGQSVIKLSLTRNWKLAMELIATKLDAAHGRRTELVEARRALLLDAAQGDDGANAKLAKVERDLADLDRTVGQLRDANDLARERDDAEKAAEAIAEHKRKVAAWEAGNEDTILHAENVDALAAKFAAALVELRDKVEHQARSCPVELQGSPSDRPLGRGRTEAAAQMNLAANGLAWAWRGLLPWKPEERPSAATVVRDGVEWARLMLTRKPKISHPVTE